MARGVLVLYLVFILNFSHAVDIQYPTCRKYSSFPFTSDSLLQSCVLKWREMAVQYSPNNLHYWTRMLLQCILFLYCELIPTRNAFLHDQLLNLLTPNNDYSGRTAPLTSKRCILYIISTNICTEYFEHVIYSPSFPLQNAVCFINRTYLVPVLFTFYIQGVIKLKK